MVQTMFGDTALVKQDLLVMTTLYLDLNKMEEMQLPEALAHLNDAKWKTGTPLYSAG